MAPDFPLTTNRPTLKKPPPPPPRNPCLDTFRAGLRYLSRHPDLCASVYDPNYALIALASLDLACTAQMHNVPCTAVYAGAGPVWECDSVDEVGCWWVT